MKLNDDGLRRLFNDPQLRTARAERGCPGADAFPSEVEGPPRAADRARFADHLVACPDCAGEYRLATSVRRWASDAARAIGGAGADRPAAQAPSARRLISRLPTWGLAVAASVLLALGVALILRLRSTGAEETAERGEAAPALATDPLDRAVLSAAPERLRWPAVGGADSYRVALYDSESTLLWKSDAVAATETELPAAIRQGLQPGRVYLWRVFARVGLDERASGVFEFALSPKS
jgi:hypothetical protein